MCAAAAAADDGGVDVDDDPWAEAAQTRRAVAADAMLAPPGLGGVDSDVRVMGARSDAPGAANILTVLPRQRMMQGATSGVIIIMTITATTA